VIQLVTHDMQVCLGKDRQHMTQHLTAIRVTVTELKRKMEGCGHTLYTHNFFSFSAHFHDMTKKKLNVCNCQAKQEGHAIEPKIQDSHIETEEGTFKRGSGAT